jgi:hypothetical protein
MYANAKLVGLSVYPYTRKYVPEVETKAKLCNFQNTRQSPPPESGSYSKPVGS